MSSFHASRYRIARRPYTCADCGREIPVGTEYLNFKTGLHSQMHICPGCSVRPVASTENMMRWHCAATVARVRNQPARIMSP